MTGSWLGPRGSRACAAPRVAGHDVADETPPPGEERGGGPRVIYRWPNRGALPAPARDLARVLDDVARYIRRYVVLSDPQARACTLWVAHCHVFAAAEATPYPNITSAVKQCGKTRLLEVLEPIVPSPWLTGRVSAAVLTRKVDGETPTLLLDESEYGEALRSILNSGYRRSGISSLCVGQSAGFTYRDFSTFCPKALAGIGALPDTVTDRSIRIALKRRALDEPVDRFRLREIPRVATPLRVQLEVWRGRAVDALRHAEPELPIELGDRAADVWGPLLAIADLAGGDWPMRTVAPRRPCPHGCQWTTTPSQSACYRTSVRSSPKRRSGPRTWLHRLVGLEDRPWADGAGGRPITQARVARLLRPFGIHPLKLRFGEKQPTATPDGHLLIPGPAICPGTWNSGTPPSTMGMNGTFEGWNQRGPVPVGKR